MDNEPLYNGISLFVFPMNTIVCLKQQLPVLLRSCSQFLLFYYHSKKSDLLLVISGHKTHFPF